MAIANGSSQPPVFGGLEDDYGEEARLEAEFSQDVVQLLRTAPIYEGLGLPYAPTTVRHMDLEEWLASKKIVAC